MGYPNREEPSHAERMAAYYDSCVDPAELSPRVRMALRLYVHCAVPTMKEAARAASIHKVYLSNMARTVAGRKFMETAHAHINNTVLQTTELIEKLSRRAIEVIGTTMEDGSNEGLRLKAAIDLADRGPVTSKIQKHQVESFTLSSQDARGIAEAMVAAAALKQRHIALADENFDRVNMDLDDEATPIAIPHQALKLES